jgi:hypothetical protein
MADRLRALVVLVVALVSTVLIIEGPPGLVVVPLLAAWWWLLRRFGGDRFRNPFRIAISLTAVGALFIVAGAIGYDLISHDRLVNGAAWSDAVIWWEVGLGIALLAAAAYFWRVSFGHIGSNRRAGLSN